jgi:acyl carrier protein
MGGRSVTSRHLVEERIREIMALVFERPVAPGETVSFGTEPAWDSLRHVELIFSIEDEFEIRFEEPELAELTSLHALTQAVSQRTLS